MGFEIDQYVEDLKKIRAIIDAGEKDSAPAEIMAELKRLESDTEYERLCFEAAEPSINRSGLPPKLRNIELNDLVETDGNRDAFAAAKQFVKKSHELLQQGRGLFLTGPAGCGKSALAAVMLKEVVRHNTQAERLTYRPARMVEYDQITKEPYLSKEWHLSSKRANNSFTETIHARFIQTAKWLKSLRDAMNAPLDPEATKYDAGCYLHESTKLVVLDDVGTEYPTDWAREQIYLLIDDLYTAQISIIGTSNLSLNKLRDVIGERAADRLSEMCAVRVMTNPSWRQKS
ncbi:MAG TPA: hypothetical protein PKH33_12705 [bacterium]|nr:hypothetical protein [bacterium]